jgi:hypothetical protein
VRQPLVGRPGANVSPLPEPADRRCVRSAEGVALGNVAAVPPQSLSTWYREPEARSAFDHKAAGNVEHLLAQAEPEVSRETRFGLRWNPAQLSR